MLSFSTDAKFPMDPVDCGKSILTQGDQADMVLLDKRLINTMIRTYRNGYKLQLSGNN